MKNSEKLFAIGVILFMCCYGSNWPDEVYAVSFACLVWGFLFYINEAN